MPKWGLFTIMFITTSCGGFRLFSSQGLQKERQIASIAVERLINEENQTFVTEIEDKLRSLYSYQAIAQKNLNQFDESLRYHSLHDLYQSSPYLKLLATKTQIDEIEDEISEALAQIADKKVKTDIQKGFLVKERIIAFSKKSPLAYLAMESLAQRVDLVLPLPEKISDDISFADEYKSLEEISEFQIYEKNIEHLSHLMETEIRSPVKKFKPSDDNSGNLTGEEFPEKVWALTFNSGPHKRTKEILDNLKRRNLKATFFHLGKGLEDNASISKEALLIGMEIGSQSFSHKDLSKAGHITLEKEITDATALLEKTLDTDIKFFRLPYGAGINMPLIRQLIAKNNLIHAFWNIDSLDWVPQTSERIAKRTINLMAKTKNDAGIILFHEIYHKSVIASEMIMDHLIKEKRRVCSLGKIIEDMNAGKKIICSQKYSSY